MGKARDNRTITFLAIALLWQSTSLIIKSPFFPPITSVLKSMIDLFVSGVIFPHMASSLITIVFGFSIAVAVGISAGIAVANSKPAFEMVMPVVDFLRPVSAIALFPLFLLLFGLGLASRVAVIFWTAWPAALLNTLAGILAVDKAVIEAAKLDGANKSQVMAMIKLPMATPTIMTGLRLAMGGGWISLVSAEMLGATTGLGFYVLLQSQSFDFPAMYATILIIAILGLSMNSGLYYVQRIFEREFGCEETYGSVRSVLGSGKRFGFAGHKVYRVQNI